MKSNGLVGSKVGVVFQDDKKHGSYQEYVCADTMKGVFPLPDEVPVEDAASFFVNPYTAVGIMHQTKELGSPGFVHTAASSQLGQMLVKLCKQENMTLINVVRRDEQAEMLKALGAEHVVVSSKEGWKEELANLVKEKNISVAFDAIAGQSTGDMIEIMPNKGTTFVYGGLSEQPVSGIAPMDLIYRKKKVEGWLLNNFLFGAAGGSVGTLMRINGASKVVLPALSGGWSASQFVDVTPEEFWPKFLEMRKGSVTNQKLRIRWPQPEPPAPATEAAAGSETPAAETPEPAAADAASQPAADAASEAAPSLEKPDGETPQPAAPSEAAGQPDASSETPAAETSS